MFKKLNLLALFFVLFFSFEVSAYSAGASGGGGGGSAMSASGGGGGTISSASGEGGGRSIAAASGGGGGRNIAAASGGGGGFDYADEDDETDSDYGISDESFENAGWEVVSRNSQYVLLCSNYYGSADYCVYRVSAGGYVDHQYLNWYVDNVWDSSESFDYNKFLRYVNKYEKNLNKAFGGNLYFDGSAEDIEEGNFKTADSYVEDNEFEEPEHYSTNNIGNNDCNVYGKLITSNNSLWIKNQDGSYSLYYVEPTNNQITVARSGRFSIVENNGVSVNVKTYYFDDNGKLVLD